MLEIIYILIGIAISFVVSGLGYKWARELFSRKLRYVQAAQTPAAPFIAGAGALLLAMPVVGLLPLLGLGTAVVFGLGVGFGAAAGTREVKGRLGGF